MLIGCGARDSLPTKDCQSKRKRYKEAAFPVGFHVLGVIELERQLEGLNQLVQFIEPLPVNLLGVFCGSFKPKVGEKLLLLFR